MINKIQSATYRPVTLHTWLLPIPYPYMQRLEGLRTCMRTVAPKEPQVNTTPPDLSKWQSELQGHPDPTYAEFITQGIQYDFRIGFNYSLQNLKPCQKNLWLATKHPSVVDAYLHNKKQPIHPTLVPTKCLWCYRVIPKHHKQLLTFLPMKDTA